jgi:hypothetical protein
LNADPALKSFANYFERQWLNSSFFNWQLYKAPVGLAMTNSPIERYNRDVKESFTKRLRHHLKSSLEVLRDVVSYESSDYQNIFCKNSLKITFLW